MVHRPNLQHSKIYQKRIYDSVWNRKKKKQSPRHLVQLSIWTSGVDILDIETQLNSLKMKRIQRLLNPTNALWKNLTLYQLNLVLNYNQSLALFKEKQILWSTSHKHLQKQKNEDLLIKLLNALAKFYQQLPCPSYFYKRNFWRIYICKSTVQTDSLFFIASHPGMFQINLLLFIRDLCRCLQPYLLSCTTFGKKLDFTNANHKRIYKFIMELIPNDSKHLLKTETSQKKNLF